MSGDPLHASQEDAPIDPVRVKTFARFFKNYMGVSAVVAAALPVPAAAFRLIPTYHTQTSLLATYTSLYCFLLLAFIFYSRHRLARWMFPELVAAKAARPGKLSLALLRNSIPRFVVAMLPLALIVGSGACVYWYHNALALSVANTAGTEAKLDAVLTTCPVTQIKGAATLMLYYLGIFLCAESAFILMALREYLQDLLHLSETDLIGFRGKLQAASSAMPEQDDAVRRAIE